MFRYVRHGKLPRKKHIQFRQPDGSLYAEQLFSTIGFDGPMSTMYHINLPTECKSWEDLGESKPTYLTAEPLRHRHLRTSQIEPKGDAVTGRIALMGNNDAIWNQVCAKDPMERFYKNAEADEVLFVHDGTGTLETMWGDVEVREGDYLVIPRGTIWRIRFDRLPVRMLAIESHGPVTIPRRYRNEYGQMLEHAPYTERDFRPPHELKTYDEKGDFEVVVKARQRKTLYTYPYHPFDIVGWDGFIYPMAFNIMDFQPLTGRIHLPPPSHQTFMGHNFVLCSFCPRMLDWDPEAVVVPYNHSNVDSDEIMYYVNSKYKARKGIEEGSITVHPLGIPHGPQPGVPEKTLGQKSTEEVVVMMDTFHPLWLTREALEIEDPGYWESWKTHDGPVSPAAIAQE
jgi:homogentisate 1,2-dioxygenase